MILKKLPLRWMRELRVDNHGVRAASGLVKSHNTFYVVADDELALFQFNFEGQTKINSVSLLNGSLPNDSSLRKKQKPDWEALLEINLEDYGVILLAIPSGSTENRMMGGYVKLTSDREIDSSINSIKVNFAEVYSELKIKIPELNIEGACIFQDKLQLFQRGNGASGINAVIDIDLKGFCNDLKNGVSIKAKNICSIKLYDLGTLAGSKLDFTDACTLNDTVWFLAVAEDSQSTYEDGKYFGAVLGCLDASGKEVARYEIDCASKPEGLWVEAEGNRICFYVVSDADSSTVYASIYFGKLLLL